VRWWVRLLQQLLDVCGDVLCLKVLAVSLEGRAISRYQELLEVPRDVGATHGRPGDEGGVGHEVVGALRVGGGGQGGLQQLEDWVGARAVHLHLVVHVRLGLEPVAWPHEPKRRQHLRGARVLLVAKLVGREAGDTEAWVLREQIVHLHEVPGGGAS